MATKRLPKIVPKILKAIKTQIDDRISKGWDRIGDIWIKSKWIDLEAPGHWLHFLVIADKGEGDVLIFLSRDAGHVMMKTISDGEINAKIELANPEAFPNQLWEILRRRYGAIFKDWPPTPEFTTARETVNTQQRQVADRES